MKISINIPQVTQAILRRHFFQNHLEQGAFLFASTEQTEGLLQFHVEGHYLVPKSGWERQLDIYLQMRDSERAKIMKMARESGLSAIDCHSHPGTKEDVWFSPSDISGITEFAQYAKWKLDGRPFAATVWAEQSVDAVAWHGDFSQAEQVDEFRFTGNDVTTQLPTNSWFHQPRGTNRFSSYE